jgi:hypothetical protein
MVGIYNHDYRKTAGFDLNFSGWGLEDLKFADTLLESKIGFTRAYDSSLSHPFHTKYCSSITNQQYRDCIPTKMGHLGAQTSLSKEWFKRLNSTYLDEIQEIINQQRHQLIHF